MTPRFLSLLGGGLDGIYLPVHPRYEQPPTHLAIWNPLQQGWLRYTDPEAGGVGDFDVYKFVPGAAMPIHRPREGKIFVLVYDGMCSTGQQREIERMERQHRHSGDYDEQPL